MPKIRVYATKYLTILAVCLTSKEEIEQHIWPLDEITNSALKNLINRFRKK